MCSFNPAIYPDTKGHRRSDEVTRVLVESLREDGDFDLMDFLTCFSDKETLKGRFGSDVYKLFNNKKPSLKGISMSAGALRYSQRSLSSDMSSLISPSKVDYASIKAESEDWNMRIQSPLLPSCSFKSTRTTSSISSTSVASALKLNWRLSRHSEGSTQSEESQSVGVTSEQDQPSDLDVAATTTTTREPAAAANSPLPREVKQLRSALRKSSPTRRDKRPSSVKFASSVVSPLAREVGQGKRSMSAGPSTHGRLSEVKEEEEEEEAERKDAMVAKGIKEKTKEWEMKEREMVGRREREIERKEARRREREKEKELKEKELKEKEEKEKERIEKEKEIQENRQLEKEMKQREIEDYMKHMEEEIKQREMGVAKENEMEVQEEEVREEMVEEVKEMIEEDDVDNHYINVLLKSTAVLSHKDCMLKEVLMKPWFPKEFKSGENRQKTIENVFGGLCKSECYACPFGV